MLRLRLLWRFAQGFQLGDRIFVQAVHSLPVTMLQLDVSNERNTMKGARWELVLRTQESPEEGDLSEMMRAYILKGASIHHNIAKTDQPSALWAEDSLRGRKHKYRLLGRNCWTTPRRLGYPANIFRISWPEELISCVSREGTSFLNSPFPFTHPTGWSPNITKRISACAFFLVWSVEKPCEVDAPLEGPKAKQLLKWRKSDDPKVTQKWLRMSEKVTFQPFLSHFGAGPLWVTFEALFRHFTRFWVFRPF